MVVVSDAALLIVPARLEHDVARRILDHHMQPRPPRGEAGRELVPGAVLHDDVEGQRGVREANALQADGGGALLVVAARLLRAVVKRLDLVERAQVRAKSNGCGRF